MQSWLTIDMEVVSLLTVLSTVTKPDTSSHDQSVMELKLAVKHSKIHKIHWIIGLLDIYNYIHIVLLYKG